MTAVSLGNDIVLEPYLVKALHLLHSRAKDSAEQLKIMLDEILKQKGQTGSKVLSLPLPSRKESVSIRGSPDQLRDDRKHEESVVSSKKIKFDSPKNSRHSSPSRSPTRSNSKEVPSTSPSRKSDDSYGDTDDLALEIMDLNCVVCKGLDVGPGNQLVECQDCHALYHQECHKPSITDSEVNDPRLVWYCSTCAKTLKKSTKSGGKSGDEKEKSDSKSSSPTNFHSKSKASSSSKSSSKSTSSKSKPSSSSSSSSSSGSKVSNSSLMQADKRLQIMKKKAATKMHDKRKSTK